MNQRLNLDSQQILCIQKIADNCYPLCKLQKFSSEALMIGCLSILRVDMYWTWCLLSWKPLTKWKTWAQTLSRFYFFLQCFINCLTHMAILLVARLRHVVPEPLKFSSDRQLLLIFHYICHWERLRETDTHVCVLVCTHTEGEKENSSEDSLPGQLTHSFHHVGLRSSGLAAGTFYPLSYLSGPETLAFVLIKVYNHKDINQLGSQYNWPL